MTSQPPRRPDGSLPLELWGGVECTVNRVGDRYLSQLERSGHATRDNDLDRIAWLGVRALRYPVLWERVAPQGPASADWRWTDARLARLRELDITPIAGLVHHGSGPPHTSLVSPCFAEKLAEYAGAVAERYPWIDAYTPVNEPLTTARFAGLYGVWYPHGRDPALFKDALFNELRGTVLAMRAIRRVNPHARLVQTDDLGKTYSSAHLAYQRDWNNALRWLGWDLLCGRVDRHHPIWPWLRNVAQASEAQILWFAENPCPPDVLGVNHYVTSERWIDERIERYPDRFIGGNGRERYADIECARALADPPPGLAALLLEAWERYRLPLAITEVQLDATRDDQLRWLAHCWRAAQGARDQGADVRAVTAWALFGSFDWNCLVTECRGYYETGAFDVRGGTPRPTVLAHALRCLAGGEMPTHPVLRGPGWWDRPGRHFCTPVVAPELARSRKEAHDLMPPVLVIGATGTLGRAFARLCDARGLAHRLVGRADVDIASLDAIERVLEREAPWAVINAAGYVRVDDAERDVERCFRENAIGAGELARACARRGIALATFSSDLVFDGRAEAPYVESDSVRPLNVYGRSKADAERRVLDVHARALVVRTSAFFGPWDVHNFVAHVLRELRAGRNFTAADDLVVSPTYVPDLVNACLDLLIDGESGIWHLANDGHASWAELAQRVALRAELAPERIVACRAADLGLMAPRPRFSALTSSRATLLPSLDDAIERFFAACSNE